MSPTLPSLVPAAVAFISAWLIGFVVVNSVADRGGGSASDTSARAALVIIVAGLLGVALTSVLHLVWLCAFAALGIPYAALEWGVAALLALAWCWRARCARRGRPARNPADRTPALHRAGRVLLVLAVASALLLAGLALARWMALIPHGDWDAWAIWNMRARFMHRGGAAWTAMFHPGVLRHLDYPLLQPASVARLWGYLGRETVLAPQMFCGALVLSGGALLAATGAHLRSALSGAVAAVALLASGPLLQQAARQYADTTLGIYMLASACLLAVALHAPCEPVVRRWLVLAGMLAGAAAWTKNEGLAFSVVLAASLGWVGAWTVGWRLAARRMGSFALGWLLPMGACVIAYKLVFAAATDLVGEQPLGAMLAKLVDGERHVEILRTAGPLLAQTPPWWVVLPASAAALASGLPRRAAPWQAAGVVAAALLLQLAIYYSIYVVTPHPLTWHLHTSASRLAVQIWCVTPLLLVLLQRPRREPLHSDPRGRGAPNGARPAGKDAAIAKGETIVGTPRAAYAYRRHSGSATSVQSASLLRFEEEIALYERLAARASVRGWDDAARSARRRAIVRLHLAFRPLGDAAAGRPSAAARKLALAARGRRA